MRWFRRKKKVEWYNPFAFEFVSSAGAGLDQPYRELPLTFLVRLIDPAQYGHFRRDEHDRIEWVKARLLDEGWTQPLVLTVDPSKVCLQDGNHRVVAASELGWDSAPVILRPSTGIRKHNLPLTELLEMIWASSSRKIAR